MAGSVLKELSRFCSLIRVMNGGRKWEWFLESSCATLLWLFLLHPLVTVGADPWPTLILSPQDRILILAPHPDDEVLGCGGITQQAVVSNLPVRIAFLTYGDNNEWSFWIYRKRPVLMPQEVREMGVMRHDEAIAAAKSLGLSPDHLTFLGYPDFGCLTIWYRHWADRPPFESMLTRVKAVPYTSALRPGSPYKGEEILRDLETVLREFKPTKVFVSHPSDHNPDHQALYLFTRVALWDLESEMKPEVYPYLIHFKNWPERRGYQPTVPLQPPSMFRQRVLWEENLLAPDQVEHKRTALESHRSQYAYSRDYMLSFARPNELFGDFPVVRLSSNQSPTSLQTTITSEHNPPDDLTDEERAAFIGLEWRSVQLDHDCLVGTIEFSRPLEREVESSMYIFGYRSDRPFGQMPKIHLKVGSLGYSLYDRGLQLPNETLQVRRSLRGITIRVPLKALGDPERILACARTSLADVTLDWVSWRTLAVQ